MDKLRSGNYRVQKMVNGKSYSLTFDHKPTQREITVALAERLNEHPKPAAKSGPSFSEALQMYCDLKSERLSPKYRRELLRLPDRLSDEFCNKDILKITQLDIDEEILRLQKKKLSPKTVKNYFDQIRPVLKKYRMDLVIDNSMLQPVPIKQDSDIYIPTKEEMHKLLKYFSDHYPNQYVGLALCCNGLRRSEMLALTVDDLDDNDVIHIDKAIVYNEFNEFVLSDTKTPYSVREIPIDHSLAERIREQGYVYNSHPNRILKNLNSAQKALGIEKFELHKTRHFFAEQLIVKGVPLEDVRRLGGWQKGSDVLTKIYNHSRIDRDSERKRKVMSDFSSGLFD